MRGVAACTCELVKAEQGREEGEEGGGADGWVVVCRTAAGYKEKSIVSPQRKNSTYSYTFDISREKKPKNNAGALLVIKIHIRSERARNRPPAARFHYYSTLACVDGGAGWERGEEDA